MLTLASNLSPARTAANAFFFYLLLLPFSLYLINARTAALISSLFLIRYVLIGKT